MPNMNGAELGKHLQKDLRFNSIKLVMMTSIADRGDLSHFAKIGFSGYFPKPATTSDLFDALAVVVNTDNLSGEDNPLVTHDYLQTLDRESSLLEQPPIPDWCSAIIIVFIITKSSFIFIINESSYASH